MELWNGKQSGFFLVDMLAGVAIVAIFTYLIVNGLNARDTRSPQERVDAIIGTLESELAVHVTSRHLHGGRVVMHNPFDGLLNKPATYAGRLDSADLKDLEVGHWAFCPQGNAVVYRPTEAITGGRLVGGRQLITYAVRPDYADDKVVNLELVIPAEFVYGWQKTPEPVSAPV